jgi:hypothetical protein
MKYSDPIELTSRLIALVSLIGIANARTKTMTRSDRVIGLVVKFDDRDGMRSPDKCLSTGIVLQHPTFLPVIPFSRSPRNCSFCSIPFFPTPLYRLWMNDVCFTSCMVTIFLRAIGAIRDYWHFTSVIPLLSKFDNSRYFLYTFSA